MSQESTSKVSKDDLQEMLQDANSVSKHRHPKHKVVKSLALVAVALMVALGAVVFSTGQNNEEIVETVSSQSDATAHDDLSATLGYSEGTIQHSKDQVSWIDITNGDSIAQGEFIRTGVGSRAVLKLKDGSAIRLDAASEVHIDILAQDNVEIKLITGQVYSRIIARADRAYSVVTASDKYTAQGTAFSVATGDTETLEVFQSRVKVGSSEQNVEEGSRYTAADKKVAVIDLGLLSEDEFVQWNKVRDSLKNEYKDKLGILQTPEELEQVEEAPVETNGGFTLKGSAVESGIYLKWSSPGISADKGYKIVYSSSSSSPEYGKDSALYIQSSDTKDWVVKVTDGKSYTFRVCVYTGEGCSNYSTATTVVAPSTQEDSVVSGPITLSINGSNLSWSAQGTAPHGYKVVMSTSQHPTYPENSVQYTVDTSVEIPLQESSDTYYVRVCKYQPDDIHGASCLDYSNQVEYTSS